MTPPLWLHVLQTLLRTAESDRLVAASLGIAPDPVRAGRPAELLATYARDEIAAARALLPDDADAAVRVALDTALARRDE